ncbi:MAG: hypothetical protein M0R76_05260 [Proteobacteria bacterium]|nr:hypothetical protein [Pseudomonadota bacterium]
MKYLFIGVLVMLCAGCSNFFMSAAPSGTPGQYYVVGSKAGFMHASKVWLCSDSTPECQEVEIVVEK